MVTVVMDFVRPLGQFLNDLFADAILRLGDYLGVVMEQAELNPIIRSLVIDGIFSGVGVSSPFCR